MVIISKLELTLSHDLSYHHHAREFYAAMYIKTHTNNLFLLHPSPSLPSPSPAPPPPIFSSSSFFCFSFFTQPCPSSSSIDLYYHCHFNWLILIILISLSFIISLTYQHFKLKRNARFQNDWQSNLCYPILEDAF